MKGITLTNLSSGWLLVFKDGKRVGLVSKCRAEGRTFFAATNEAGLVMADFPTRDAAVAWVSGTEPDKGSPAFWMFGGPKSARDFIQAEREKGKVLVAYRVTEGVVAWYLVIDGGAWLPSWITRAMDAGKMKVDRVNDVRDLKG